MLEIIGMLGFLRSCSPKASILIIGTHANIEYETKLIEVEEKLNKTLQNDP